MHNARHSSIIQCTRDPYLIRALHHPRLEINKPASRKFARRWVVFAGQNGAHRLAIAHIVIINMNYNHRQQVSSKKYFERKEHTFAVIPLSLMVNLGSVESRWLVAHIHFGWWYVAISNVFPALVLLAGIGALKEREGEDGVGWGWWSSCFHDSWGGAGEESHGDGGGEGGEGNHFVGVEWCGVEICRKVFGAMELDRVGLLELNVCVQCGCWSLKCWLMIPYLGRCDVLL